ncbi:hypothetical protein EV715DRAFT_293467 [Schizophyllum commune]
MADANGPTTTASGDSQVFGLKKLNHEGRNDSGYREKRRGYESKYEEDQIGEELGDDARVWRVLIDEGSKDDARQFQGIRDHLDVDLVFSGLFAAVVTTFVVQSSQALQPDNAEISANLLFEMIAIQRAVASGSSVGDIAASELRPGTVTASSLDYWVNRLWYLSLLLGLFAAFLAFIVRGWLYAYDSDVHGSPRRRALVQHYRRIGLNDWKVDLIVLSLPTLLHASMLLFFIGLALDLRLFDASMAYACTALIGSFYSLYLLSVCLPVFYPQCPYRSPLSTGVYWVKITTAWIYNLLRAQFPAVISLPRYMRCPSLTARAKQLAHGVISLYTSLGRRLQKGWAALKTTWKVFVKPSDHEWDAICQEVLEDDLVPKSLDMAFKIASDPSVTRIVVQATSGFPHQPEASELVDQPRGNLLRNRVVPWFRSALNTRQTIFDWTPGRENDLQRMACALLLVPLQGYDAPGPLFECIDTEQYCICVSRVIQGLLSAITSTYAAELDVATLSATLLALGDRLDDLERESKLLQRGALLANIAAVYSPLVHRNLRTGLRLHPAVWHHMRRYLGYLGNNGILVPCPPFAVVLWRSFLINASSFQSEDNSSGELSPKSSRLTLREWLSSTPCAYLSNPTNIAMYRLLCPASCSEHYTHSIYAEMTNAKWLHMACHAIDSYGQEVGTMGNTAFDNDLSFLTEHFLHTLFTSLGYDPVDSALDIIGYSTISSFFQSTFLDRPCLSLVEFVKVDAKLHPTHVVALFWFLVKLVAAVHETDHSDKERAICDVFRALDQHAIEYRKDLVDTLAYDVVSIERLRPAIEAILDYPQLVFLGLSDVLAATIASRLVKEADAAQSEELAREFILCIHLDVLCAARASAICASPSEAVHVLHTALLSLKTEYCDLWKGEVELALQAFIPLSLALSLNSPRGLGALAELVEDIEPVVHVPWVEAEVPYEAWKGMENDWYRRFTVNPDKHINVEKEDRAWRLPISELVTLEIYHERTVEPVGQANAEDGVENAQGDLQEEDADDGAHDEALRDRDSGAEGEAGEGDGGEGVEQSGIQASAQVIVGRIAAGWKKFYPYMEGPVLTMSKAPSFRYTKGGMDWTQ